jgi:hypothetical protein
MDSSLNFCQKQDCTINVAQDKKINKETTFGFWGQVFGTWNFLTACADFDRMG